MIRSARNAVIAIASVASLLAATSTAAIASSYTINDRNSDIQYYRGFDDQSPALLGHIPSIRSGVDVRSFRVNHGTKNVSVRFTVVHLQDEGLTATVQFQKNKHSHSRDWLAILRVHTDPDGTIHRGEVTVLGEDEPRCTVGMTVTTGQYGTIYAQIPRSCLGNASSLRAKAALSRYYKPADDTAEESTRERTWGDSVSSTHYRSSDWTPWVKSS